MEKRMDSSRMDHLRWVTYEQRVKDPHTIVLLPVGAPEQHGPHLPLGTDALLATAVAHSVTAQMGGIVAPPINYGYKSQPKCGGGQHYPGTINLDGSTLASPTCDIIAELARHGVRNIAVVSGHYENQWFLTEGIDLARRRVGYDSALHIMRLAYWDFLTKATLAKTFPTGFPGFALEHAAVLETSMMLHIFPIWCIWTCYQTSHLPTSLPTTCIRPVRTGCLPPVRCRQPKARVQKKDCKWLTKSAKGMPTRCVTS